MLQRFLVILAIFFSATALLAKENNAADETKIISESSNFYIEPQEGFETYLSAALGKKAVPLKVVSNKNEADYIIAGASGGKDKANLAVINAKTGVVAFTEAVNKNSDRRKKGSAESFASHLKKKMQDDKKALKKKMETDEKNLKQKAEEDEKNLKKKAESDKKNLKRKK